MVSEVVCAFSFGHAAMPFVGNQQWQGMGFPYRLSWSGDSKPPHFTVDG
jgi:hypothetical protein